MNESEFGQVKEAVTTLKDEFKILREDVSEIKEMMALSRGGFKVLVWVGGVAATILGAVGGFLGKFFHPGT